MACMTFHCKCGFVDFTNDLELICPICGENIQGVFDEN